jgi:CTP synthase
LLASSQCGACCGKDVISSAIVIAMGNNNLPQLVRRPTLKLLVALATVPSVEVIEAPDHPWFVAASSRNSPRPRDGHPLFSFVIVSRAGISKARKA